MHRALILLFLVSFSGLAAERLPAPGLLPKGALWNLNDSGVEGGIPDSSAMTIAATLTASATAAQINSAISAASSNQVVQLEDGNYSLNARISLKTGVVLRGQGTNTILTFSAGGGFVGGLIEIKGPFVDPPSVIKNWTAGYAQGTTTITLDGVADLAVGDLVAVDQLNDSGIGVALSGSTFTSRASGTRAQGQTARITAISGNDVTLSHGIAATNFQSGLTPQLFRIGAPMVRAGIEDLQIVNDLSDNADYNVLFMGAWDCWMKNVRSRLAENAHYRQFQTGRIEVRHCDFSETEAYASQSYGANVSFYSSWSLCEDNIFRVVTTPNFVWGVAVGNIFAFNLCISNRYDQSVGWQINVMGTHGAHPMHNLWEGNFAADLEFDFIHGSSSHNAGFRNYLPGQWDASITVNAYPFIAERNNRFVTLAGNWMGTEGFHTFYHLNNTSDDTHEHTSILKTGYASTGLGLSNFDTAVASTLEKYGNFNTVDNGVNASEALGGDTLRASWFRASKPDWWGDRPWPWVDYTSSTPPQMTNFPAGHRYVYGVDPPAEGGGGETGGGTGGGGVVGVTELRIGTIEVAP